MLYTIYNIYMYTIYRNRIFFFPTLQCLLIYRAKFLKILKTFQIIDRK